MKKFLSLMLAVLMVVGMVPSFVFGIGAEGIDGAENAASSEIWMMSACSFSQTWEGPERISFILPFFENFFKASDAIPGKKE